MPATPPIPAPSDDAPLRLLLVKLKHIGDALLLTATVSAIRTRYPNAEIWVVVRKGTEGILAGCPAIHRLLTVAPVDSDDRGFATFWRDLKTWRRLRRQRFDYAFELTDGDRGRWLAGLSGARHRCVNTSHYPLGFFWRRRFNHTSNSAWTEGHRVEKDFHAVGDFLPLEKEIPSLCFEKTQASTPDFIRNLENYVVFHPGTRWVKKRWPKEYWIELGDALLKRGHGIVISCGPDAQERSFARELVDALDDDRVINVDGRCNWSGLAGMLYGARLFFGVDTAAMHLAAACQTPIVTFFAFSVVSQWRPWKVPHELLHLDRPLFKDGVRIMPAEEVMLKLTPIMALAAADRLLAAPADKPTR